MQMNCKDCEHYILNNCEGILDTKLDLSGCFLDNQYGLASNSEDLALQERVYKKRNNPENLTFAEFKEAFISAVINKDVHLLKTDSPLFPFWNLRRAISVTHQLEIYQQLNVKLRLNDIRGESFYAGIPSLTSMDIKNAKEYLRRNKK